MMLNYAALTPHLKKGLAPFYILSGADTWLQEQAVASLKKAFDPEADYKRFTIEQAVDWDILLKEANSYSLFSEYTCLQVWLDKKTLDAAGKQALNNYLSSVNPRCMIILQAPDLPGKQWQWLEKHPQAVIVKTIPLEGAAFRSWIIQLLEQYQLRYEPQVVDILQKYTKGNQQACIQALEKLSLLVTSETVLTVQMTAEQIMDQSEWQIFDLSQACLQADAPKALYILRQAAEARIEITLVLWVLSQEIRLTSRLSFLLKKGLPLQEACAQLKIWNTRISAYQNLHIRIAEHCDALLKTCKKLDEWIKTGKNQAIIWQQLESIALLLCLGKKIC